MTDDDLSLPPGRPFDPEDGCWLSRPAARYEILEKGRERLDDLEFYRGYEQ